VGSALRLEVGSSQDQGLSPQQLRHLPSLHLIFLNKYEIDFRPIKLPFLCSVKSCQDLAVSRSRRPDCVEKRVTQHLGHNTPERCDRTQDQRFVAFVTEVQTLKI
jgi:hypothetical protein